MIPHLWFFDLNMVQKQCILSRNSILKFDLFLDQWYAVWYSLFSLPPPLPLYPYLYLYLYLHLHPIFISISSSISISWCRAARHITGPSVTDYAGQQVIFCSELCHQSLSDIIFCVFTSCMSTKVPSESPASGEKTRHYSWGGTQDTHPTVG